MQHVTNEFSLFMAETLEVGQAYMEMVKKNAQASSLDKKTQELAYIAVLSAIRMTGGLNFHVKSAKAQGRHKGRNQKCCPDWIASDRCHIGRCFGSGLVFL